MAVFMSDTLLDAIADVMIAGFNQVTVCAGQPANIVAIGTNALAQTALVGGDYTKANGDVSGRKVTTAAKAAVNIATSGTADHIVLDDGVKFAVFTCTSKVITAGDKVDIPALTFTAPDPVAA